MTELVKRLDIKDKKELRSLLINGYQSTFDAVSEVLFKGLSYAEAGRKHKVTRAAIYESLTRLYEKKYGNKYNSEIIPPKKEKGPRLGRKK